MISRRDGLALFNWYLPRKVLNKRIKKRLIALIKQVCEIKSLAFKQIDKTWKQTSLSWIVQANQLVQGCNREINFKERSKKVFWVKTKRVGRKCLKIASRSV